MTSKKKKKLIIYNNQGKIASEYPLPKLINESLINKWATRLFSSFRTKAVNRNNVDSWDIKSEEE